MEIKVLGTVEKNPGMFDSLFDAIEELGIKPKLEVLDKTSDFIKYKVRAPGAIVINGDVVFKGHQDLSDNIMKALKKTAEKEDEFRAKLASGEVEIVDGKVVDHTKGKKVAKKKGKGAKKNGKKK